MYYKVILIIIVIGASQFFASILSGLYSPTSSSPSLSTFSHQLHEKSILNIPKTSTILEPVLGQEGREVVKGGPVNTAIIVTTEVFNDDGGTSRPSDFRFSVWNNNQQMSSRQGEGLPGVRIPVQQGSVRVSEVTTPSYANYIGAMSEGCLQDSIRNGQILRCNIYYDDKPRISKSTTSENALLVIKKRFLGNGNPLPVSNEESLVKVFTYPNFQSPPCRASNVQGCVDVRPFREFNNAVNPSRMASINIPPVNIPPGFYIVHEEPIPNYRPLYSPQCSNSAYRDEPVMPGQIRYCTIYNIFVEGFGAGRLNVAHIVFNDNGGTKRPSDFRHSISSVSQFNTRNIEVSIPSSSNRIISATPPHQIGQTTTVVPSGSYEVTQVQDPRYFTTFSPGCRDSIDGSQTKRCTIYNDDKPSNLIQSGPPNVIRLPIGALVVITRFINDNGGSITPANLGIFICGSSPSQSSSQLPNSAIRTLRLQPCPSGLSIVSPFSSGIFNAEPLSGKVFWLQPGSQYVVSGFENFPGSAPRQQYEISYECRGTAQAHQTKVCFIVHDDKPR